MSVQSAQSITVLFDTRVFATGVGTNADSLPTGTLYLNGVANAATVTVTNITTGVYKAQVTLPTLSIGDHVQLVIAATVSTISDSGVIWGDCKDVLLDGSGDVTFNNTSIGTVTTVTNQLTAAAIATGVWQDATSGDFTTASSIGKSLYTSGVAPGGSGGLFIAGTNDHCTITNNFTVSGNWLTTGTTTWTGAAAFTNGLTSNITGNLVGTVSTLTTYTGNTVQTGDSYARIGVAGVGLTNVVLPSGGLANVTAWTVAITGNITGNLVGTVSTLTTYTGNTPQTGDSYARIGAAGVGLTNVVLPSGGLANVTAWTVAITGNITGNLSGSVGSVTGAVGSVTGAVTVSGDFSATMKTSIGTAVAASAVASVTGSVGSIAGVTFPTGFSTLTVAAIQTGLATPTNITAGTITTTTNLTNAPTSGDFTAAMKTSLNAATPASVQNLAAQTGDSYAVVNSGTFGNAVLASGLAMAITDISAIPTDPITSLAGIATSTNISSLQTHGDSTWATATGFAVAGSAMTLTTGERTAIATALLVLDLSTLSGEASQSMLNAVRKLRNKWSISGTTLTVYKEDGTTTAYTQTLTATAGAAPITGIGA